MQRSTFGKLIVLMSVVLLLFTVPLRAADSAQDAEGLPIRSVSSAGNVTLSEAEVLAVVRARPGQKFDAESASQDCERLAKMDAAESAYYNVKIEDGQVALTYVMVERNLVRSITFKGNKKFQDRVLAKELTYKVGDYLDVFAVRAGAEAIEQKYQKKGYPWISVTLDEQVTMLMGQITYIIDEGPRPKITELKFEGNQGLSDGELKKAVKSRSKKFLLFSVYYNDEQLEQDRQKLLTAYQTHAFLDAEVNTRVEYSEDKKKAKVVFEIKEGPVYIVDTVAYNGNAFLTDEQLSADMKLRNDYYYSEAWAEFDAKKIVDKYGAQGYIQAKVNMNRVFLPGARVRVDFNIEEGPRARIGDVEIVGNRTIQDRSIRRILDEEGFTPGKWYRSDIARGDGKGELEVLVKQTAVTESVTIQPLPTEDPEYRDVLVTVKEGQTGSIMLGAGVASDSGLIGQISLDQRNFDITDWPSSFGEFITGKAFRGAGQRFRISLNPGTEVSTYLVSFTEPYLYDLPVSLNVSGISFERERESYDEGRMTGKVGLEKRYSNDWRRGISIRGENVNVDSLTADAPQDVIDVEGENMLFGLRFYIRKDTTDNMYRPSRGYNFDAGYEQVLGDHSFGNIESTYRWYKTLHEDLAENKTILETRIHAGANVGDAPVFERFYLGGSSSMRGFEYRGISNRSGSGNKPIGSPWVVNGSAEVAIPMGSEMFAALLFTDFGMIETGGLRSSVGTGIQIMIPQWFGPVPMRFEVATPITKDDLDETQYFSFSMGALF